MITFFGSDHCDMYEHLKKKSARAEQGYRKEIDVTHLV